MSNDFVMCGALRLGVGLSPVYCDVTTGDLVFSDDLNGNCLFSNMSLTDPIDMSGSHAFEKMCADMQCDGIILSNSYIITLKDDKAEYRQYGQSDKILQTVEFDLDTVYEDPRFDSEEDYV